MSPVFLAVLVMLSLVTMFAWTAQVATVKDLSETLKSCYLADKSQLNGCLLKYCTNALPLLATGVDGGPRLDPLYVGHVKYPEKGTFINGNLKKENVTLSGLSDSVVTQVITDVAKRSMTVHLDSPFLKQDFLYDFASTIKDIPVIGQGVGVANFTDNNVTMVFELEPDGQLAKFSIVPIASELSIHLDTVVGSLETVNNMLNENGFTLFAEVAPGYLKLYSERGFKVFEPLFRQFPIELFKHKE